MDLRKYCWINEVTRKALVDTKISNICRCKYLTTKLWSKQNMLGKRSIRDTLVTGYSALTHCFFYSTVWLIEKVRKMNVTGRQEPPLSDLTAAAASRAKLGKAIPSQSHHRCYNSLPPTLCFTWALNAFGQLGSDPTFYCNSPSHLRADCSKPWRQRRGSTCPKPPRVLCHSCWEQSRNWHKGALTSKANTQHQDKYPWGGWESKDSSALV